VLGLAGVNDPFVRADFFVETMSAPLFDASCSVQLVDDAGHHFHQQKPEVVHSALLEHLQQSSSC
jgi:pimeloyl-ACP methyl ester carboxylesterase